MRSHRRQRGFSLIEVLVSIGVIALVCMLIYSAFRGMSGARDTMIQVSDRHHEGRSALARMSRELSSAFISAHRNFLDLQATRETAFIGDNGNPSRVDFTAFAHQRLRRDAHESDQAELSYFLSRNPDGDGYDLVRRIAKQIDEEPGRGGIIQVMASNVEELELRYLDPLTGEWIDSWDSTQPAAQPGRLPAQVWIRLVLTNRPGHNPITFQTKAVVAMQLPIQFATGN